MNGKPLPERYACPVGLDDGELHDTTTVYRQCTRCGGADIVGYACDTCGHTMIEEPDSWQSDHGPGGCRRGAT